MKFSDRVGEILKEESISAGIVELNVGSDSMARDIGFLGSPGIRTDGMDIEPSARSERSFGMACRTYVAGGRREGLPSSEMVRQAILDVQRAMGK